MCFYSEAFTPYKILVYCNFFFGSKIWKKNRNNIQIVKTILLLGFGIHRKSKLHSMLYFWESIHCKTLLLIFNHCALVHLENVDPCLYKMDFKKVYPYLVCSITKVLNNRVKSLQSFKPSCYPLKSLFSLAACLIQIRFNMWSKTHSNMFSFHLFILL